MSHLKYNSYPGFGEQVYNEAHYSTAVRIPAGETVTISGQGGWDRQTRKFSTDIKEEVDQAFENVHVALTSEGGKGMEQVYKIVAYTTEPTAGQIVANMRKWFPNHRPLLTVIGVRSLAWPEMHIEVEAWAHLG